MDGEEGVGLDRQVIEREVRRRERQRRREVGRALGERLARQRVHQVEVEGGEGGLRFVDRGARLRRVVDPAERVQLGVVEALHSDRQPRDAGLGVSVEAFALEGARVGLERDLAAGLERQAGADRRDQSLDRCRREQARRPAADEDGVDASSPDKGKRFLEVAHQRVDVARLGQRAGLVAQACELKSQYGHFLGTTADGRRARAAAAPAASARPGA